MSDLKIIISPSSPSDFSIIAGYSAEFSLDCEKMSIEQFLVAKKNNRIAGFGRLRTYPGCTELATIGVVSEERGKGIGTAITQALIKIAPSLLYVVCVIPGFFSRFGFKTVTDFPEILMPKVDFCMKYGYCRENVSVMLLNK